MMTEYEIQKAREEIDEMNRTREKIEKATKEMVKDLQETKKNYEKATIKECIAATLMGVSVIIQLISLFL